VSEDFVRSVLREHCEATMPHDKDPWPAIRARAQAGQLEHRATPSPGTRLLEPSQDVLTSRRGGRTLIVPRLNRSRLSMAMVLITVLAFAAIIIGFAAGIRPLPISSPPDEENASTRRCWNVVSSPDIEGGDTALFSISAISASEIWAVGYSSRSGIVQTLTQRWNGSEWRIVPSLNVPSRNNYLSGVAALTTNDVWAVGYHCKDNCTEPALLIEHWDGTQWSIVPTPGGGRLNGIAAVSADDIWAVGSNGRRSFALHWDGQEWLESPTNDPPLADSSFVLNAATAITSNDVWAVGYQHNSVTNSYRSIIYHWDGRGWVYSSETGGRAGDSLQAVAATSASDIWAVGQRGKGQSYEEPLRTVTKHWDGSSWLEVASPNVGAGDCYLRGVDAISSKDVWAVGGCGPRTGTKQTVVLHWQGLGWSIVPSPNVEGNSNRFFAIEAILANNIWAVGTYNSNGTGALVERYNRPCTQLDTPRSPR